MRFLNLLLLSIFMLFLIGCIVPKEPTEAAENKNLVNFKSEKYGFSFSFPSSWKEVTKDLPDRWAIVNNKDTVILTVNKAQIKNLLALGKIQAIRDIYPEAGNDKIEQKKVDEVNSILKLATFNDATWYTYAIKFSDKNVNSIVSGTLCNDNEINLVMVSDFDTFDKSKAIYSDMLNSFEC